MILSSVVRHFFLLPMVLASANFVLDLRVHLIKFDKLYKDLCPDEGNGVGGTCGCSVSVQFVYDNTPTNLGPYVKPTECFPFIRAQHHRWPVVTMKLKAKDPFPLNRLCANFTPVITGMRRTFLLKEGYRQTAALTDISQQPFESIQACQNLVPHQPDQTMVVPELNISDPNVQLNEDFMILKYTLKCAEFYFDELCKTRCKQLEFGHYTCDSEGRKVCKPGYFDPFKNCTCRFVNGTQRCGGYVTTTLTPPTATDSGESMEQLILVLSVCLALVVMVCACIGVCIYIVKRRGQAPPPSEPVKKFVEKPAIVITQLSEVSEEKSSEADKAGIYLGDDPKPSTSKIQPERPEAGLPGRYVLPPRKEDLQAQTKLVEEMRDALDTELENLEDESSATPQPEPKEMYQSSPCLTTNGKLTLTPWLSQPQLPNGLKESYSQELAKRRFKVQTFVI